MPFQIDEEYVFPVLAPGWTRFDERHAHAVFRQRLQQRVQDPGAFRVAGRDQDRRLVLTGRR